MIEFGDLLPAAEQGWAILFELADESDSDWVLVGGQMMYLLAKEHGTQLPRPTDDMDVVVDIRTRPGGTGWLATWLLNRDWPLAELSRLQEVLRLSSELKPLKCKCVVATAKF